MSLLLLNEILSAYLNGTSDTKWQILANLLCHKRISPPSSIAGSLGNRYEKAVTQELLTNKTNLKRIPCVRPYKNWFKEAKLKSHQKFLKPVYELHDYINNYFTDKEILGFYVHGSISTLDYVPYYSDFDTLVIIRKEVLRDEKWLIDLKKRLTQSNTYLYLLDLFQHHGHFVVTEYDMMAYHEGLFPVTLFRYTTELSEFGSQLEFHAVEEMDGIKDAIRKRFFYYYEYWPEIECGRGLTAVDVKNLVQDLILLAVFYAEVRDGRYYYKREVFKRDLLRDDFTGKEWNLIERASQIRQEFPQGSRFPYWFRKMVGLNSHPRLLHLLHRWCDGGQLKAMMELLGENVLLEAQALVRSIAEKLGIEGK